jgi:uncharacterized protein (TIGR00106 family)
MLADLTIIPVGGDAHTSGLLADVLKAVESSGLQYQLTPSSTCIEGSWDQLTDVAKKCHEIARKSANHVVTMLRIEDDASGGDMLKGNIASVEQKAGQPFSHAPQL